MNYKNSLFLLLLLVTSAATFGQDSLATNHSSTLYPFWVVKLPLLSLIDPNSPNLCAAVERRLNGKNSVQFLAGISTDLSTTTPKPHDYSAVNGFRLRAEYRHYYHVRRKAAFFLGADVFYTGYRHYTDDSFISQSTNLHYYDSYYLKKKMTGVNVKWGIQYHNGNFVFETFAGPGLKQRTVTETGRTAPGDEHVPLHFRTGINVVAAGNDLGDYTTMSATVNFVIGYIFH